MGLPLVIVVVIQIYSSRGIQEKVTCTNVNNFKCPEEFLNHVYFIYELINNEKLKKNE
jgi:hypothetical protein